VELIKKYKIDDNFIGIFENFFSDNLIKKYLSYYEYSEKNNLVDLRQNPTIIKDSAAYTMSLERSVKYNNEELINIIYEDIYPLYINKFNLFNSVAKHSIFEIKIQKTKPSEGYHAWHNEINCRSDNSRLFTFILYLNDVLEGGETEFLYQKCRINALKNRFVLWPAGLTHKHRGNPPLKNDKYILTGWMEFA
jgi:hypothetical protein